MALGIIVALFGCGGGGGDDSSPAPAPTQPANPGGQNVSDKGLVMGKVTDETGAAVGSASLQIDSTTVNTNEQGFFTMQGVTPATGKVLKFNKNGYVPGFRPINIVAGQQTFCNLTLRKVGRTVQWNNTTQEIQDARSDGRNGKVSLQAGSVVNSAGTPVSSAIVEITTLLPSDANFYNSFPGGFKGGTTAGTTNNPQPLISYGVVNVDLKDAAGNKLFLGQGKTATITFPIDPAHDPGASATSIPLWSLDQASGIWVQEGFLTRGSNVYTGTVSHFSPWNCDQLFPNQSAKRVRVTDMNGNIVKYAYVVLEGTGYRQVGYTDDGGIVTLITVPNDTIRVWAEKGTLISAVKTETAAGSGQVIENTIQLINPLVSVTLTWGVNPSDLDSHMTGPKADGSRFHVYYAADGDLANSPNCALDTDDVSSYGPEIITVTKLLPGVYRYSVHNYSGQATFKMENSGAEVNLIVAPGGIIRRYNIPTTNPGGNTWTVFELNVDAAGNVSVTDINRFSNTDPSGGAVTEKIKR